MSHENNAARHLAMVTIVSLLGLCKCLVDLSLWCASRLQGDLRQIEQRSDVNTKSGPDSSRSTQSLIEQFINLEGRWVCYEDGTREHFALNWVYSRWSPRNSESGTWSTKGKAVVITTSGYLDRMSRFIRHDHQLYAVNHLGQEKRAYFC